MINGKRFAASILIVILVSFVWGLAAVSFLPAESYIATGLMGAVVGGVTMLLLSGWYIR